MIHASDIREQLAAHNLGHLADRILPLCQPAIRLNLTPSAPIYTADASLQDASPVGVSKVGGYPDLPPGFAWPYWEEAPLPFLAQFRLADVTPFDAEGILPKTGMLYFFWDVTMQLFMYGGDPVNWKIVHDAADPASLARTPPPPGLPEYGETNPNRVVFEAELTVPSLDSHEMAEILTDEEERERYWEFARAFRESGSVKEADSFGGNPHHHLLGCTDIWYNDPRPDTAWRLLIVIDTDRGAGLNWGDAGIISFVISGEDLRLGRFDGIEAAYEGG